MSELSALHRWLPGLVLLFGTLFGTLAGAPAQAASDCGGKGERACCAAERPGKPCDKGLEESGRCKKNCACGKGIGSSRQRYLDARAGPWQVAGPGACDAACRWHATSEQQRRYRR